MDVDAAEDPEANDVSQDGSRLGMSVGYLLHKTASNLDVADDQLEIYTKYLEWRALSRQRVEDEWNYLPRTFNRSGDEWERPRRTSEEFYCTTGRGAHTIPCTNVCKRQSL